MAASMSSMAANALRSVGRAVSSGLFMTAQLAWMVSVLSARFVRDAVRAHYHLLGRYTYDIEKELNKLNKSTLTLFSWSHRPTLAANPRYLAVFLPFGLLTILLSVTLVPLFVHTILSFKTAFLSLIRLPLPKEQDKQLKEEVQKDDRTILQHAYGILGSVAGFIVALPVMSAIFLGRVIYNSFITGYRTFSSTINFFALHQDDKVPTKFTLKDGAEFAEEKARIKYGLGLPGLVIGGLLGVIATLPIALGRVYTNTYKTAYMLTESMANLVLHKDDAYKISDTPRHPVLKYGLGFPGLVLGLITGAVLMLIIATGRTISNSWYTGKKAFLAVVNPFLYKDEDPTRSDQIKFTVDPAIDGDADQKIPVDTARKYGFGLPGYLIGGALGVGVGIPAVFIGRFITNNFKAMRYAMLNVIRATLTAENQTEAGLEVIKDTRSNDPLLRFVVGIPGTILGLVVGGAFGIVCAAVQTFTYSFYTGHKMFAKIAQKAAATDNKFGFEKQDKIEKSILADKVYGAPGYLIGTFIGGLAAGLIILPGRYFRNSARTASQVAQDIMNITAETKSEYEDDRSFPIKYIVGFPGVLVGLVIGVPGALLIAVGRIIKDSFYTFGKTFTQAVNLLLHEKNKIGYTIDAAQVLEMTNSIISEPVPNAMINIYNTEALTTFLKDYGPLLEAGKNALIQFELDYKIETNKARYYGFGLLGNIAGGATGVLLGWPVIFVGRIITNTAKSIYYTTIGMMKVVIDDEDLKDRQIDEIKDPAAGKDYRLLGVFGRIIGVATGLLAIGAIVIGRTLSNSSYTFYKTFSTMVKPILHKNDEGALSFEPNDKIEDSPVRNLAFGWAGYVFGALAAIPGLLLVGLGRVITNSFKSIYYTTIKVMQAVVSDDDQKDDVLGIASIQDNRDRHQHVLGIPGYIAGVVIAACVGLTIAIGRTLSNSSYMFYKSIKEITDKVLHKNDQLPFHKNDKLEKDKACQRYGVPGRLIGWFVGGIFAVTILGGRVLTNTGKSWLALSKSLLNLAAERKLFYGVGADQRSFQLKIAGMLGYALAAVTTTPLALAIYFFRKLPTLVSGLLGLLAAIVVLFCKAISKMFIKDARFSDKQVDNNDLMIQKFKNLYSSLNAFGELNAGTNIQEKSSGEKPIGSFVRKCVTFDQKTSTETVLDALLKAYKNASSVEKASFFKGKDAEIVNQIKEDHRQQNASNCFATAEEQTKFEKEVDNVADVVHAYMDRGNYVIPSKLYQGDEPTWGALFMATPVVQPRTYHGTSVIIPGAEPSSAYPASDGEYNPDAPSFQT